MYYKNKKAYNNSKKLDFSQKTSYYIYNFFKKNKKNVFFENKLPIILNYVKRTLPSLLYLQEIKLQQIKSLNYKKSLKICMCLVPWE